MERAPFTINRRKFKYTHQRTSTSAPGPTPGGSSEVPSSRCAAMRRATSRKSFSAAVGKRCSSRIELTSVSSVERCFLGETRPARWDPASVKRFSADLFHACFVLSGVFLRVEADSDDRKRLDTKDRVGGWGVRGEARRPLRPRCIAGLAEKVSALSGPRRVGWTRLVTRSIGTRNDLPSRPDYV